MQQMGARRVTHEGAISSCVPALFIVQQTGALSFKWTLLRVLLLRIPDLHELHNSIVLVSRNKSLYCVSRTCSMLLNEFDGSDGLGLEVSITRQDRAARGEQMSKRAARELGHLDSCDVTAGEIESDSRRTSYQNLLELASQLRRRIRSELRRTLFRTRRVECVT